MSAPIGEGFRPVLEPSTAAIHRQWLDRGLPASTWPAYLERVRQARHVHDLIESGMTDSCNYGCKVFRCPCGESEIRHMASYGCPIGLGQIGAQPRLAGRG